MKKTNAARILDALKIAYKLKEYEVDLSDLSARHVAESVEMPPETVFKTLVACGDKSGVIMTCIPGNSELDLKSAARASRNKKVDMVHLKDVQNLTGYIRGGVSPLGAKKNYPVFIDQTASQHAVIAVSAGIRGGQILLSPSDLLRATGGVMADLIRK